MVEVSNENSRRISTFRKSKIQQQWKNSRHKVQCSSNLDDQWTLSELLGLSLLFLVLFLDGYTWDGSCLKEMTDAAWIIFKTLELARAKNWYSNEPNVQWPIFSNDSLAELLLPTSGNSLVGKKFCWSHYWPFFQKLYPSITIVGNTVLKSSITEIERYHHYHVLWLHEKRSSTGTMH